MSYPVWVRSHSKNMKKFAQSCYKQDEQEEAAGALWYKNRLECSMAIATVLSMNPEVLTKQDRMLLKGAVQLIRGERKINSFGNSLDARFLKRNYALFQKKSTTNRVFALDIMGETIIRILRRNAQARELVQRLPESDFSCREFYVVNSGRAPTQEPPKSWSGWVKRRLDDVLEYPFTAEQKDIQQRKRYKMI